MYARRRTYRKRTYRRRRTTTQSKMRYMRKYTRTPYRRRYKSRYTKRTSYNKCPVPDNRHNRKELNALIKQNEEYTLMYTDGGTQTAAVEDFNVIGSFQINHSIDLASCFARIPGDTPTTGGRNLALIMKAARHLTTFTNYALESVDFNYWICIAKRDIPVGPSDTQFFQPHKAWILGVEDPAYGNQAATTGQGGAEHPYSQPTDSSLFRDMWHVCKRGKFQLLPGGVKDIAYKAKNLPYKLQNASDGNFTYIGGAKGIVMAIMWQARGAPVANNGLIGGTNSNYYSRPKIGIIENKRYHFTFAADGLKSLSFVTDGLSGALATPTWVNPLTATNQNGTTGGQPIPVASSNIAPIFVANTSATPLTVQGNGSTLKANAIPVQNAPTTLT